MIISFPKTVDIDIRKNITSMFIYYCTFKPPLTKEININNNVCIPEKAFIRTFHTSFFFTGTTQEHKFQGDFVLKPRF